MWDKLQHSFEASTINERYILEFSHLGFSIHCRREVGAEIGSKVFLEDYY